MLEPVARRRRRRRYRPIRLAPLLAAVVVAFVAGAWAGAGGGPGTRHGVGRMPLAAIVDPAWRPATTPAVPVGRPVVLLHGPALLAGRLHVPLVAPEAILVDADTGQVLWERRAHERRPVASTTKIMTALLALRALKPHDVITVDRAVTRVPLVREGLHTGEQVQVWKLFYALLLYSGNDDALQLAISSAGSKAAFLLQMNAEAARLSMTDTHFTSPSGVVDVGNYSSAWDLAALTREALQNPVFRRIVDTKQIRVGWAPPIDWKLYINNNWLLREYPGANGVKTGYTHEAGWCLVASATRRGHTLVAVVLHSPDMYNDARKLLDLGFASLR